MMSREQIKVYMVEYAKTEWGVEGEWEVEDFKSIELANEFALECLHSECVVQMNVVDLWVDNEENNDE
jgi:hypothetical protein